MNVHWKQNDPQSSFLKVDVLCSELVFKNPETDTEVRKVRARKDLELWARFNTRNELWFVAYDGSGLPRNEWVKLCKSGDAIVWKLRDLAWEKRYG